MQHTAMDFGTGVMIGGLALSACWGWLWLVISTMGLVRGVCRLAVVRNSMIVAIIPVLLGWGLWWLRPEAFSPTIAFVAGLFVVPLLLTALGLRKAADGRRAGLHMVEGIRHLKDELLGVHHECGGCGHDHGADRAGGCP